MSLCRYKELVAAALQKLENKRELTLKEVCLSSQYAPIDIHVTRLDPAIVAHFVIAQMRVL